MPTSTGWTREQLLIALRLYMRLPFGRLHGRNPQIIELAGKIHRTPNALAMKACNFASLDPAFRASNRKGLSGASAADRALWQEFSTNAEQLAAEAEETFTRIEPRVAAAEHAQVQPPAGETDVLRMIRARRVQSFFRAAVLTSYQSRCAITGLAVPELLVASHIIPWSASVERRADPTNGICLNALFDRAFDRGLIAIDEDFRVVVSRELRKRASAAKLGCSLCEAHGQAIRLPERLAPDARALARHRSEIFTDQPCLAHGLGGGPRS
jgi:putative restriction endonuclease